MFKYNVGQRVTVVTLMNMSATIIEQHQGANRDPWYMLRIDGIEGTVMVLQSEVVPLFEPGDIVRHKNGHPGISYVVKKMKGVMVWFEGGGMLHADDLHLVQAADLKGPSGGSYIGSFRLVIDPEGRITGVTIPNTEQKGPYNCPHCGGGYTDYKFCCEQLRTHLARHGVSEWPVASDHYLNREGFPRPMPKPGETWAHENGIEYEVMHVTNLHNTHDDHPPHVVYYNKDSTSVWSRPLKTWHDKMTFVR